MSVRIRAATSPHGRNASDEWFAAVIRRYLDETRPEAPLAKLEGPMAQTLAGTAARLALALQRAAGLDVGDWYEMPESDAGESEAVFVCVDQLTGRAAATLALRALLDGPEFEHQALARRLSGAAAPWLRPLTRAAALRGIPIAPALQSATPFVAMGQGTKRRIFWKNFTPATSHIGTVLTTRKDLAAQLMRNTGLPAPRNILAADVSAALQAAASFGYPVVIKPASADYGRGVSPGITGPSEVAPAFERAREFGAVLVEEHIEGDQHRLLVIGGRCAMVTRLRPARVVGDGVSSVATLVEVANRSRTDQVSGAFKKIDLDEVAHVQLRRQGLSVSSVPAHGQVVLLRMNANLSTGGTREVVTEMAHPEVLRLAERAAGLFGLDLAGIDYLSTDITRAPVETRGAICEVNVTPLVIANAIPLMGEVLSAFFPPGEEGRITTLCMLGPPASRTPLVAALASLLEGPASRTDQVGSWSPRAEPPPALPLHRRVDMVLSDPVAQAALIVGDPDEVVQSGLGLDRCDCAVLMPGVARPALEAVLRVARAVVVPASVAAAMPEAFSVSSARLWIVGDRPPELIGRATDWVRWGESGAVEVLAGSAVVAQVPVPGDSEMAAWVVAAGAALGVSPAKIGQALRAL
jgi:cyanophycin synthetase